MYKKEEKKKKKGIYKHYKGNLYELIGIANHSETLEKIRAKYTERG